MARQKKDGKGRLGGRAKGTPNKVTGTVKDWLTRLIDKNRSQIEQDLKELEPKERVQILEKFMQYVIPKMQGYTIEEQIKTEYEELEKLLEKAPEQVIDILTERIINLKKNDNE